MFKIVFLAICFTTHLRGSFEDTIVQLDAAATKGAYYIHFQGFKIHIWTPEESALKAYQDFAVQRDVNECAFNTYHQSRYVKVYGKKNNRNAHICFHNGINTTLKDALAEAIYTSCIADDVDVTLIYNGSLSFSLDLHEYNCNTQGICTVPCVLYAAFVRDTIKKDPQVYVTSIHHSQGVVQGKLGLELLSEEEKARINFLAVAPGGFLSKNGLHRLLHLVSERDIIPKSHPCCVDMEKAIEEGTVQIVEAKQFDTLFDHSYTSPTYAEEIYRFVHEDFRD